MFSYTGWKRPLPQRLALHDHSLNPSAISRRAAPVSISHLDPRLPLTISTKPRSIIVRARSVDRPRIVAATLSAAPCCARMNIASQPVLPGVLVVEDEPLLLLDAMDVVADARCKAYGARSAVQALGEIERHPDIRILLTDIRLYGAMNGLQLAFAVRERWPSIEIIVVSGVEVIRDEDLPERSRFLPKPYSPTLLVQLLEKLSGRGGADRSAPTYSS